MAKEHTDVVFLKVDVEELDDLAAEYEISCMPTFIFIKQGAKVGRRADGRRAPRVVTGPEQARRTVTRRAKYAPFTRQKSVQTCTATDKHWRGWPAAVRAASGVWSVF